MKLADISTNTWESMADAFEAWRAIITNGVERVDRTRNDLLTDKQASRRQGLSQPECHPPSAAVTVQETVILEWDLSTTLGNVPKAELYMCYTIVFPGCQWQGRYVDMHKSIHVSIDASYMYACMYMCIGKNLNICMHVGKCARVYECKCI